MYEKESIICPRCGSFIGELSDLDVCPVCAYSFFGDEENK